MGRRLGVLQLCVVLGVPEQEAFVRVEGGERHVAQRVAHHQVDLRVEPRLDGVRARVSARVRVGFRARARARVRVRVRLAAAVPCCGGLLTLTLTTPLGLRAADAAQLSSEIGAAAASVVTPDASQVRVSVRIRVRVSKP